MNYPFEFSELLITSGLLDVLGFSEYWGGSGDFGDRSLDLGGKVGDERLTSKKEYPRYMIREQDAKDDECDGYCGLPYKRVVSHFTDKDFYPMYFIHEMYEDIVKRRTPEEVKAFIELTKAKNIYYYIDSYLKSK
jgi:hypothetical protein